MSTVKPVEYFYVITLRGQTRKGMANVTASGTISAFPGEHTQEEIYDTAMRECKVLASEEGLSFRSGDKVEVKLYYAVPNAIPGVG
jgi:hypothetical protein